MFEYSGFFVRLWGDKSCLDHSVNVRLPLAIKPGRRIKLNAEGNRKWILMKRTYTTHPSKA